VTVSAFFGYWGLLLVGFVLGCAWAGHKWVPICDDLRRTLARSIKQTDRAIGQRDYTIELLEQARQPKITILPSPEDPEGFDWKAGIGVP